MYRTRNTNKQKILLEQNANTFRTSDLALLWGIENHQTLNTTIGRYVHRGILIPIFRGLYSTKPLSKLNKFELGCAIAGPFSYISAESVLEKEGVIMQNLYQVTLFGLKAKVITIEGTTYNCRFLNRKYLLNREGIIYTDNYSIATKDRAIADLRHVNPYYYLDNLISVDELKVQDINSKVGYKSNNRSRYKFR